MKEEAPKLEEIPLGVRLKIFDILYPDYEIKNKSGLGYSSIVLQAILTEFHIPTHKIKINA